MGLRLRRHPDEARPARRVRLMLDAKVFISAKVIGLALVLSSTFYAAEVSMCEVCNDKAYLICTRADGRRAVERCDQCASDTLSDEQAAILARYDGECAESYPCYLKEKQ
jgi:hypothetical protein